MEDEKIIIEDNGSDANVDEMDILSASHHQPHSHSHSHHSRRRSSTGNNSNGKKKKFKKFVKKYRKRLITLLIILLLALALISWALIFDNQTPYDTQSSDNGTTIDTLDSSIQLKLPLFTESISLVSPAVEEYLSPKYDGDLKGLYNDYKLSGRLDKGLPVKLFYDVDGIPLGCKIVGSVIEVSETPSFYSSRMFNLKADETYVEVYSLKVNTQYYYRITLTLSNGQQLSSQGSFVTANTPRMLDIDGAVNVRDIGGWTTTNGKTIKQGLLFRGSELEGAMNPDYKITQNGVNEMLTVLGIKTELDLRPASDNPNGINALGMNVKHIYISSPQYSQIFNPEVQPSVKNIFSQLANKDNYPIYMHCTYGLDRTGTICYLLEAVLGLSENDLIRDYELSAMYHKEVKQTELATMISTLRSFEGATIQKKAENYLLSIGVTAEEILNIKQIFLE